MGRKVVKFCGSIVSALWQCVPLSMVCLKSYRSAVFATYTLKDGDTAVTLLFRFVNGLITPVRAEARGRTVASAVIPNRAEVNGATTRCTTEYASLLEGEVAWLLPEGPKPYWRGRITSLRYEFAQ
jgi:hypothetical protein